MASRVIRRPLGAATATAILAVVVAAQPAFALFWNGDETGYPVFSGKVGQFAGPAGAEVVCRYNNAGRLRSVTVHPLVMWGNYEQATTVGWRYQLRRATEFQAGPLVYKSRIWRDDATLTTPADGFKRHRFYVRQQLPGTAAYYVAPVMLWYAQGDPATVEGRAPVVYDRYLLKRGSESRWSNACVFDYSVPFWNGE
jgi:hypothetical protein